MTGPGIKPRREGDDMVFEDGAFVLRMKRSDWEQICAERGMDPDVALVDLTALKRPGYVAKVTW